MSNSSNAMMIKTKAMHGQRLKANDYQALLQKKTVAEVASYLKTETQYKDSLEGINEKSIHRGQLEILIRMNLYKRFSSLMKYTFDTNDDFYRFAVIESEINQILATVRSIMSQDNTSLISNMPIFIAHLSSFDFTDLAKATSIEDLLKIIEKTSYYPIVYKFKKDDFKDIDYVGLEHNLKKKFYEEVLYLAKKNLKADVYKNVEDIILTQIELENFSKIYRLKKFFKASSAQIKLYITPIYHYFSKQMIDDFIETCDADSLFEKLKTTKYGNFMDDSNISNIEYYMKKINHKINEKYMYFSSNADIVLLSYMILCETEIQNIIDIIEGIRYKIATDKISRLLIY